MMTIALLMVACFFAAFVDAIAGGGGLISLPAYLIAGLPPHLALGTNKFASSWGTLFTALRFWRKGKVNLDLVKYMIPMSFLGSILGVKAVMLIRPEFLAPLVVGLILLVGIYTMFSKSLGRANQFEGAGKRSIVTGMLFALGLGIYDGFFGPGTGTFLMFGLMAIFKFDFVNANGNTKVLNVTSNIAALLAFAVLGKIDYAVGIPCAVAMIAGGQLGARLAIRNGSRLIRPVFILMSFAASIKIYFDYFS